MSIIRNYTRKKLLSTKKVSDLYIVRYTCNEEIEAMLPISVDKPKKL